jgi:staphylococcal nuclease domain-containing protein 1
LAKLTSFGLDRIPDASILTRAEQSAKQQKLKVSYPPSPQMKYW